MNESQEEQDRWARFNLLYLVVVYDTTKPGFWWVYYVIIWVLQIQRTIRTILNSNHIRSVISRNINVLKIRPIRVTLSGRRDGCEHALMRAAGCGLAPDLTLALGPHLDSTATPPFSTFPFPRSSIPSASTGRLCFKLVDSRSLLWCVAEAWGDRAWCAQGSHARSTGKPAQPHLKWIYRVRQVLLLDVFDGGLHAFIGRITDLVQLW